MCKDSNDSAARRPNLSTLVFAARIERVLTPDARRVAVRPTRPKNSLPNVPLAAGARVGAEHHLAPVHLLDGRGRLPVRVAVSRGVGAGDLCCCEFVRHLRNSVPHQDKTFFDLQLRKVRSLHAMSFSRRIVSAGSTPTFGNNYALENA